MKLLLDTHVWIWTQETPDELGSETRRLLLDPDSDLLISAMSTLELARLVALGRIVLAKELFHWVRDGLAALDAHPVPVDNAIAAESYRIPEPFHRDPADRVLVATARIAGCTLLSADRQLLDYPHVASADARR